MKILEEKAGYYHLAQEGDRYYLGLPDRYLVKLKPREVKDYLRWGTKALDEISRSLSNNLDKLEARNLAGIDLMYALHQYRVANGLPMLVERDGHFEWEVLPEDAFRPDLSAPMRLVLSGGKERWNFFGKGERYFLDAQWSSSAAELRFAVELLPEEVASYKAFGDSFVREFARKIQDMSGASPEFKRNLNYYVAERTPEERAINGYLMDEMVGAAYTVEEGEAE